MCIVTNYLYSIFKLEIATSSNHPVHIINEDGTLSPSAFVPVCEFGGDMGAMGIMIDQFDFPVCNSFQAKIIMDQLCYEVDLNKYKNYDYIEQQLKLGFVFFMDYNEDRQVTYNLDYEDEEEVKSLASRMSDTYDHQNAQIILNTMGKGH